jgi:hypothetical protein
MDQIQPTQQVPTSNNIVNKIPGSGSKLTKIVPIAIILIVVSAGIFTGLILSSRTKAPPQSVASIEEEELPTEVRESFAQTFKDEAEGIIEENDELDKYSQGTHKLIRPGGESQTAYLTSSILDLDEYTGKKVKVLGETFGSSQVGWLMDVGKVEVIE